MTDTRKSGSRPYSPIYHSFQDLLENNQGVFRLFRKAKNPGMYQAVWQSRQAEVETLKERLIQLEKVSAEKNVAKRQLNDEWENYERHWFEQHNGLLNEIENLKEVIKTKDADLSHMKEVLEDNKKANKNTLAGLEGEIELWKQRYFSMREEMEQNKTLNRSIDRVIAMKTAEVQKLTKEVKVAEESKQLSQLALVKLDEQHTKTEQENQLLKQQIRELESELKKSESYAKEFRRINHRMENELYRVNNELERFQSLIN